VIRRCLEFYPIQGSLTCLQLVVILVYFLLVSATLILISTSFLFALAMSTYPILTFFLFCFGDVNLSDFDFFSFCFGDVNFDSDFDFFSFCFGDVNFAPNFFVCVGDVNFDFDFAFGFGDALGDNPTSSCIDTLLN